MKYSDGKEAKAGDEIQISGIYNGLVVVCIDSGDYLPGHESWDYLKHGIMVDTDFGGLVYYTQDSVEHFMLVSKL